MDDGVGEDVLPLDTNDGGGHLQGKDSEYYLRPETRNVLGLQEMRLPSEGDYSTSSRNEFHEMFDGKNMQGIHNVNLLEHPYNIPRLMNDAGAAAVEELTVRNLNGSGLAVIGTSNGSSRMQGRQSQWQHLYQLGGGAGGGGSRGNIELRDNGQRTTRGLEDAGYSSFPEFLAQKAVDENPSQVAQPLINSNTNGISSNASGSVRTKMLSKSGFSNFFVKNTLKGKGIVFKGPPQIANPTETREPDNTKLAGKSPAQPDPSPAMDIKMVNPCSNGVGRNCTNGGNGCDGVNLREWLKDGHSQANKMVRLRIFRQIVELVDYSHSQGVVLHRLRPSYFQLLPSNRVRYLGSPDKNEILQSMMNQDFPHPESLARKRPVEQRGFASAGSSAKKQRLVQNTGAHRQWLQVSGQSSFKQEVANASHGTATSQQNTVNELDEANLVSQHGTESKFGVTREHMLSARERLEEKWYTSPEEPKGGSCSLFSNIYFLGVFLFELLAHLDSDSALVTAMSDLRHRILPPNFLSENPKEAGFCLWLLHPEPSSRPTTREILQSDVVNGLSEECTEDLVASIDEEDTESDLLMHFLGSLKEHEQKDASKLVDAIQCLEADIKEIEKRNLISSKSRSFRGEFSKDVLSQLPIVSSTNEQKLTKNFDKFENAYFSMRTNLQTPMTDATIRQDIDLLRARENLHLANKDEERQVPKDRMGAFFDGLCKYARHSRFEVRGVLRNGEFNSSSNVICSLSFDRDEDYFAAAGVSKKIKIYDFNYLLNDSVDIHYPAIEMPNRSKLSSVCWNGYIKNYLASSDYDGSVKLWDASTGQAFLQYNEHEKRAWSVDFSKVYPTKLASGSDDCTVKLWNMNEKNSLGTIRNVANVCCVQFSAHSTYLLAFGSADYRTYCYDLRYARTPWCVLSGHEKAVSYVKFLDSETLVSASTDNTLKLWDLNKSTPTGSPNACTSTLKGHTNEKNFVGLSVADGYIACGSESNEVYAYYRSLPMPITSHKFGSIDSISGKETEDDNGQFVSSVCWRAKSEMVVAANSSGCIKVLQMI